MLSSDFFEDEFHWTDIRSVPFEELLGKTITKIDRSKDEIHFYVDGGIYRMYHRRDCCEQVDIDDICGDLDDLVGSPILHAYEANSNSDDPSKKMVIALVVPENHDAEGGEDSHTWTFYTASTIKGSVTIRWYGWSNGYYSESVDFDFYPVCQGG